MYFLDYRLGNKLFYQGNRVLVFFYVAVYSDITFYFLDWLNKA